MASKYITFENIVAILQDSFDEDLTQYVEEDDFEGYDLPTDNPLAGYLVTKLWDNYNPEDSNKEKIDKFFSVIEDVRDMLNSVETSLDNWEELIDVGDED